MSGLFWLSKEQLAKIESYFPLAHGVPRVDDRMIVSGIIFGIRNGLRWRDAREELSDYIRAGLVPHLPGKKLCRFPEPHRGITMGKLSVNRPWIALGYSQLYLSTQQTRPVLPASFPLTWLFSRNCKHFHFSNYFLFESSLDIFTSPMKLKAKLGHKMIFLKSPHHNSGLYLPIIPISQPNNS